MTDALDMFQAMRPQMPAMGADMRPGGNTDLHSLAMVPGSPSYRSRIPLPPCYQCGEDHVPNHDYGHAWVAEPAQPVHDEPVSASAIMRRPAPVVQEAVSPASPRRVALYVGRGDTYIVIVEEPPDWEPHTTMKVEPALVLPLINLARALDVRVLDKTGGDLLMLEQEADNVRRQPEKNNVRGAEGDGDRHARRQGAGAPGPEED